MTISSSSLTWAAPLLGRSLTGQNRVRALRTRRFDPWISDRVAPICWDSFRLHRLLWWTPSIWSDDNRWWCKGNPSDPQRTRSVWLTRWNLLRFRSLWRSGTASISYPILIVSRSVRAYLVQTVGHRSFDYFAQVRLVLGRSMIDARVHPIGQIRTDIDELSSGHSDELYWTYFEASLSVFAHKSQSTPFPPRNSCRFVYSRCSQPHSCENAFYAYTVPWQSFAPVWSSIAKLSLGKLVSSWRFKL